MAEWRKPYRLNVYASGFKRGKRVKRNKMHGEYCEITPCDYGFMAWNPEQAYNEARLPGAGSFLYPGIIAVRKAAMEYLTQSNVRQVAVRTNQDREVYRWFKSEEGRISGYSRME